MTSPASRDENDDSRFLLGLARLFYKWWHPPESYRSEIRVTVNKMYPDRPWWSSDPGDTLYCDTFCNVAESHYPARFVLLAPPRTGKSYAFACYAAKMASQALNHLLDESFDATTLELMTVPILVDIGDYRGSFVKLVENSLPDGVSFDELVSRCKVAFLFDSFSACRASLSPDRHEADLTHFSNGLAGADLLSPRVPAAVWNTPGSNTLNSA